MYSEQTDRSSHLQNRTSDMILKTITYLSGSHPVTKGHKCRDLVLQVGVGCKADNLAP